MGLRKGTLHGYTLMELMIAVVIVGVLAAIAVPTFRGFLVKSRVAEANGFLGTIRARQEAYRSEFGQYCAVDGNAWGRWTPAGSAGRDMRSWPAAAAWQQLGARPDGPVRFQYSTIAGFPGSNPPGGINGYNGSDFWYAARARADFDNDGTPMELTVFSISNQFVANLPPDARGRGWD